jgi:hypothetical protein
MDGVDEVCIDSLQHACVNLISLSPAQQGKCDFHPIAAGLRHRAVPVTHAPLRRWRLSQGSG